MGFLGDLFKPVADVIGTATTGVPWGSVITSAGSLIGGERANSANIDISSANNAFNAEEAAKNRAFQVQEAWTHRGWQEQQRATQYQTAVQDMQAAGLNPMLAYQQGGAGNLSGSVPSGSAASSAGNPTMRDSISPAISTGMQAAQVELGLKAQQAQIDKTNSERAEIEARTKGLYGDPSSDDASSRKGRVYWEINDLRKSADLKHQNQLTDNQRWEVLKWDRNLKEIQGDLEAQRITESEARTLLLKAEAALTQLGIYRARNDAEFEKGPMGQAMPYIRGAGELGNSAGSVVRGGLGLKRAARGSDY